ncbi:Alpha-1,6-mannosylglycoprotein 6-beta-N-acetylglucosaminyltransferase B [Dissostichus eleginoides]|nr:Alpha-1,6-mannosylglycoprotein 6-beta-N-acetylglucosaminyltransferase B [Dissostichus eleginoides]
MFPKRQHKARAKSRLMNTQSLTGSKKQHGVGTSTRERCSLETCFDLIVLLGGQESRGVLRKISDMLEVIMKRMDALSKVGNSTDAHRLDELSSALDRIQPVGLVERIQAIAQNMSDMAGRVEQILQRSMAGNKVRDGTLAQCGTPKDPRYPDCLSKMDWMRARWTSDPCYAFYGVDGSDCSFLVYLSEVEWFCPPLIWRNQTATPTLKPLPKKQLLGDPRYPLRIVP